MIQTRTPKEKRQFLWLVDREREDFYYQAELEDKGTREAITREEAEVKFPHFLQYIRENVSLVELMRSFGFSVEPLSPDAPDIYVVEGGCPDCKGNILVRDNLC